MVLIYQVLTRQCLKKVFLTSNDFVPNDSSPLKGNPPQVLLWDHTPVLDIYPGFQSQFASLSRVSTPSKFMSEKR